MNTEYLFGIYQAKRRMTDASERKRLESGLPIGSDRNNPSDARAAMREEAYLRVFEAVRASVEGIWYYR